MAFLLAIVRLVKAYFILKVVEPDAPSREISIVYEPDGKYVFPSSAILSSVLFFLR